MGLCILKTGVSYKTEVFAAGFYTLNPYEAFYLPDLITLNPI